MTFTEDDKDCLEIWMEEKSPEGMYSHFVALLARLEAAEKVCLGIQTVCEEHKLQGQAAADLKAWRKAAGK